MLLLDEPLGALDLKLREQMQGELKALQRELGITFVFVTHDQGEALSMADRVAVFNEGRIVQVGTPTEVYERPRTRFVADFVGGSNVLEPDARRAARRRAAASQPAAGEDRDRSPTAPRRRRARSASTARSRRSSTRAPSAAIELATGDGRWSRPCPPPAPTLDAGRRRSALAFARERAAPAWTKPMSAAGHRHRAPPRDGVLRRLSDVLLRRAAASPAPAARAAAALARRRLSRLARSRSSPQSFFSIDEFSGLVDPRARR